jgi:hypothetical protein
VKLRDQQYVLQLYISVEQCTIVRRLEVCAGYIKVEQCDVVQIIGTERHSIFMYQCQPEYTTFTLYDVHDAIVPISLAALNIVILLLLLLLQTACI